MAVITISRQYGSGGDEIASQLCELLGYRYFDKSMMAQVASDMGLSSKEVIDSPEDRHQVFGFLDRLFGQKVAEAWESRDEVSGARTVELGELDSKSFVATLRSIVQTAYEQGDVVILGRGGQVILRDQPGVLRVRIEAPFEERVRRVREQQRFTSLEAARDFVAGRDRAGADYLRTYYKVDWNEPELYHLMINTGLWSLEAAAHIIVDALKYLST
ncbi:MAG: cytidylate kinase-like family protein [Anaerolineae bacterium]|nr:cytidylate kinase-like family protein [Anaerolineae bacterium]